MAGRKPTPTNLKSASPEGVVRTFKSIPEAARELGFSEAAVNRAVGTAAALFGLSVFLFTENPLKCFIL